MKKQLLSKRVYKAGYEIRRELVDGSEYEMSDFEMKTAYTPTGDYIGDTKLAHRLCKIRGIKPEVSPATEMCASDSRVCTIGYSKKHSKWYGWSHRALSSFGVGDVVESEDHSCSQSGWTPEYLEKYPEHDFSLPVGFKAGSLDDARLMAIAFAESVG